MAVSSETGFDHVSLATFQYEQDSLMRLSKVKDEFGTSLVHDLEYDSHGRMFYGRFGDSIEANWDFDTVTENLTRLSYWNGNQALTDIHYSYDAVGNIENEWRTDYDHSPINTISAYPPAGALTIKTHTYNGLDRLSSTSLSIPGQDILKHESFEYSPNANIESAGSEKYWYRNGKHAQAVTELTIDGELIRSLQYNADGQVEIDDSTHNGGTLKTLDFDAAGCLKTIQVQNESETVIGNTEQVCGQDGQRVYRRTVDSHGSIERVVQFAGIGEIRIDDGDHGTMLFRMPVGGTVSLEDARSLLDGSRIEEESGFLLTDVRGSVVAKTNLSGIPSIEREAEYSAWGETYALSERAVPRHGFVSQEIDPIAGYYYFGRRVYDPTLKRWLSPDPLFMALPSLDTATGEELNLYQYSRNNPVRYIDLTGLAADEKKEDKGIFKKIGDFFSGLFKKAVNVNSETDERTLKPYKEVLTEIDSQGGQQTGKSPEAATAAKSKKVGDTASEDLGNALGEGSKEVATQAGTGPLIGAALVAVKNAKRIKHSWKQLVELGKAYKKRGALVTRANSRAWGELKPYRSKTKTNGLKGKKSRFYEWDHTHNDIEVYNGRGIHLGSMDPTTGEMIKEAVRGRYINL